MQVGVSDSGRVTRSRLLCRLARCCMHRWSRWGPASSLGHPSPPQSMKPGEARESGQDIWSLRCALGEHTTLIPFNTANHSHTTTYLQHRHQHCCTPAVVAYIVFIKKIRNYSPCPKCCRFATYAITALAGLPRVAFCFTPIAYCGALTALQKVISLRREKLEDIRTSICGVVWPMAGMPEQRASGTCLQLGCACTRSGTRRRRSGQRMLGVEEFEVV